MESLATVTQYSKAVLILNQLFLAVWVWNQEINGGKPRAVELAKSFRQADSPSLFRSLLGTELGFHR